MNRQWLALLKEKKLYCHLCGLLILSSMRKGFAKIGGCVESAQEKISDSSLLQY